MSKTTIITTEIDPKLKHCAEDVFRDLGLTAAQAIALFYKYVELERGLPFVVRIPNDVTTKALEQARTPQELANFNTLNDLFEDSGI